MIELPQFILAEARRAQYFADLVERIKRLNNLEQAEAEATARIAALAKAEAEARARLEELTGRVASEQNKHAAFIAEISAFTTSKG